MEYSISSVILSVYYIYYYMTVTLKVIGYTLEILDYSSEAENLNQTLIFFIIEY